jgi:hypothetical protein
VTVGSHDGDLTIASGRRLLGPGDVLVPKLVPMIVLKLVLVLAVAGLWGEGAKGRRSDARRSAQADHS